MGLSIVLSWLAMPSRVMEAQRRWLPSLQLIISLAFLGVAGHTLLQLSAALTTHQWLDWMNVWTGLFIAGFAAFCLIFSEPRAIRLRKENALALRAAAIAGDDARAPVASHQPARLPEVERALSYRRVDRMKPVPSSGAYMRRMLGGEFLVLGLMSVLWDIIMSHKFSFSAFSMSFFFLGFAGVYLAIDIGAWKPIAVTADAQSFTWIQPRRRVTTEWSDVRAFCLIERHEPLTDSRGTAYYLLVTDRTHLLWQRPIREGAKGYDEAEHLASLVATYCGLALRDISHEVAFQAEIAGRSGLQGMFGTAGERAQLAPLPKWWKRRALYPFFAALSIEALLIVICVGAVLAQTGGHVH
jgi:hypothetical protein